MNEFAELIKDFCFRTPAGFVTLIIVVAAILSYTAMKSNRDITIERLKQGIVMEYYQDGKVTSQRWIRVK